MAAAQRRGGAGHEGPRYGSIESSTAMMAQPT